MVVIPDRLLDLGYDLLPAMTSGGGGRPARVVGEGRGGYLVDDGGGEFRAEVSGRLRFDASGRADFPVVGDWVLVKGDPARIRSVLPRRTLLRRKAASGRAGDQPIAANIDAVFAMHPVDRGAGLRWIERSLVLIAESGARAVVLLSKCDLLSAADLRDFEEEARAELPGAEIIACSAVTGAGLDRVRVHVRRGLTLCCIGPSGAGKSTLINVLAGEGALPTAAVRESDARGRHTTSRRELLLLPGGGVVIDTPGMRELGLPETGAGLEETFPEIIALARECRFRDCTHVHEPGCAVRVAAEEGRLSPQRLESYCRLRDEAGTRGSALRRGKR